MSADSVSRIARRALERAGIVGHTGHSLRRTFATAALLRSDIRTVQHLLRHRSMATSEHYLAVPDLERMRDALAGQHVGTYWWSWHARGDEEHGTVDHEYVVHPT